MKVTQNQIKLLLIVFGLLIVVAVFFFVFRPKLAENETVEAENAQLRTQVAELETKVAAEPQKRAEMAQWQEEIDNMLTKYPSYLLYENNIMDIVSIEENSDTKIHSLTVANPSAVEITVPVPEDAAAAAATGEGAADAPADGTTEITSAASRYTVYDQQSTVSYTTTYKDLKYMIDAVVKDSDRNTIDTVTATFDSSTGQVTGSALFSSYFIFGQEKDYVPAEIPDLLRGTENIFGTNEPTGE